VEGDVHEPEPHTIASARAGDLGAFETLVRHYQGDVWRLSFHLIRDEGLADDVTQEAFVRAYRFLPRYRWEAKFSTWLFSIARNCARDELRRAGRRRSLAERLVREPGRVAHDHSLHLEVREAVAALPLELREPVVLIDMFGVSYREVAFVLSLPVGTVKSRVHRARAALAAALGQGLSETTGEA
jgi:RNA polymerase sigma-70 factor, ECF subfamily